MPSAPEPPRSRGSLLRPIQHRVLREEILDRLRASILTGDVEPGARLVEGDVAGRMGTSRVPVREAIRQLEQEGLVELHPHRGAVVASLSEAEIDAVYEIRAVIEAEAIRRACALATTEDIARLDRLCADMEHALRMHDLAQVAEIDLQFHEAVLAISDFGLVRRVWRSVDGLIRVRTFRLLREPGPLSAHYLRAIVDRHRSLVAAISARDADAAAAQARRHVLEVRDRMAAEHLAEPGARRRMTDRVRAHPYIPNSAPAIRAEMLAALGIESADALYASVPAAFRLRGPLDLPPPLTDEVSLRRHVEGLLARNTHTGEVLSFLGGGCSGGHVPAVVDEITRRAEFVTAYGGGPYGDHGKYQAIFEFQSLIGELVGMPAVSAPTYDGITATTSALLMAARLTGRSRLLVPQTMHPDGLHHLRTFARPWATIDLVPRDAASGGIDLAALRAGLAAGDVAAVLLEMPSYLGFLDEHPDEIAAAAHAGGARLVVSVDPSTLGVLAPPADYGADIVSGDAQSLGIHQLFGGGQCGFIAHRDEEAYVRENPAIKISAVPSLDTSQTGFAWALLEATSYDLRGESRDFTGTSQWLWGIGAAVYLALLGPAGMRELGGALIARSAYAVERLAAVPGVRVPAIGRSHVREFVVDLGGGAAGRTAAAINAHLRERGIFAGIDLSRSVPWLGESLLVAVNEAHTQADIDRFATELEAVLA